MLYELTGKSLSRIFLDEVHDLLMQRSNSPFEYSPEVRTGTDSLHDYNSVARNSALYVVFACGAAIPGICEPTSRWNLRFEVRWIAANTRSFTETRDLLRQSVRDLRLRQIFELGFLAFVTKALCRPYRRTTQYSFLLMSDLPNVTNVVVDVIAGNAKN
jgi:hypothetical protein